MKHYMKLLNYYNEYSTYLSTMKEITPTEKQLLLENLRFLGNDGQNCYRFELANGIQIIRRADDTYITYEAQTDIDYSDDEIKKIVFKQIVNSDKTFNE